MTYSDRTEAKQRTAREVFRDRKNRSYANSSHWPNVG